MLRGSYTARIDDKGRLKIPSVFKKYFDEKYEGADFYVTSLDGTCAWLYPLSEWEEVEKRLALLPSMDPTRRKFLDRTGYYGQLQSFDAQGRVLIHPLLRASAELMGEVTVLGRLTYLEVWEMSRFLATRLADPFEIADEQRLSDLGI
jgi:MraZ protein